MTESDDAWQRRLDWGLGEIEGGAPPPDVTAKVLARVAGAAVAPMVRRPRSSRWLAAALILLGVAVVANAVWFARGTPVDRPAQERGETVWHRVATLAEIAALPADARHVVGANLGDAELAALAQRGDLQGLRLLAATFVGGGPPCRFLSPTALRHLRRLPKLRVLDLDWQEELAGADLGVLADLPLLEELGIVRFDTDDAALAVLERMPSLRSVDLTLNHGFHGDTLQRLCRMPGLRRLSLHSCSQLSVAMLAPLASATRLRDLDLSGIGSSWRGHLVGRATDEALAVRRAQQDAARSAGAGLDAGIVQLLPPQLQRLCIGCQGLDDGMVRALCTRLRDLEDLDLADSAQLGDAGVAAALALPRLRHLDLSRCPELTAGIVDPLAKALRLQRVALTGHDWLTLEHAERLLSVGIDVVVEKESPVGSALPGLRQMHAQALQARAAGIAFLTVTRATDLGALPADAIAIEGHDLDDATATALVRQLPRLQRLRLRNGEQTKTYNGGFAPQTDRGNGRDLTDAGIRALGALPDLVELELAGTVAVGDDGIASLQRLARLERLHLACFDVTDRALTALPGMPALRSLQLELAFGSGAEGVRAIAACRGLEELTLAGLPQLQSADLTALARSTSLRRLTLANLSTTRNDNDRPLSAPERERRTAALAAAALPTAGLHDDALLALAGLTGLEQLRLGFAPITAAGLTALAHMPRLQLVALTGFASLQSDDLRHLPRSITSLDLAGCERLDDRLVDALAGMRLQSLDLALCSALTDGGLARLVAAHPLERLGLSGCGGLTAASADLLFATPRIRELEVTGCKGWTKQRSEQARTQGRRIVYRFW